MGNVVFWVSLAVVLSILVVAAEIWDERRSARKYGSLRCPGCGAEFGPGAKTTWHTHTQLAWQRWTVGGAHPTIRDFPNEP
jgi:hypothetical protein